MKSWYMGGYEVTYSRKQQLSCCLLSEVKITYGMSKGQIHPWESWPTASPSCFWPCRLSRGKQPHDFIFLSPSSGQGEKGPKYKNEFVVALSSNWEEKKAKSVPRAGALDKPQEKREKKTSPAISLAQLLLQLPPPAPRTPAGLCWQL